MIQVLRRKGQNTNYQILVRYTPESPWLGSALSDFHQRSLANTHPNLPEVAPEVFPPPFNITPIFFFKAPQLMPVEGASFPKEKSPLHIKPTPFHPLLPSQVSAMRACRSL